MKIINTIRYKLQYGSTVEWYNFLSILTGKSQTVIPKIVSIDDTLLKIIIGKYSVSRLGDGEMLLMDNRSIRFQKSSPQLATRLLEVFQSNRHNHLVCISDTFEELERYNRKARRFWRTHFYIFGHLWDKYLQKDRVYYNTFITRPYMDFMDKSETAHRFELLKKIWDNRDIVFIEGEKSRLGVGNNLFGNAKSVRRILCPAVNAFREYDRILQAALKVEKSALFLLALGPTATVLAYDLCKAGIQAIDIGHVDVEYEWFCMKTTRKVKLPMKYVNEAPNGTQALRTPGQEYKQQIIDKIY